MVSSLQSRLSVKICYCPVSWPDYCKLELDQQLLKQVELQEQVESTSSRCFFLMMDSVWHQFYILGDGWRCLQQTQICWVRWLGVVFQGFSMKKREMPPLPSKKFRGLSMLFFDTPSSGHVSNCSLRHLCAGLTNRKKHTHTHAHMHTHTCQPADVLLHTHHRSPVYTLPQA